MLRVEGTTVLLLSTGIGIRSFRRSAFTGFYIAAPLAVLTFFEARPGQLGHICSFIKEAVLAIGYGTLSLTSILCRRTSRPAALLWVRIWSCFHLICAAAFSISLYHNISYCTQHAENMVIAIGKTWLCYKAFEV